MDPEAKLSHDEKIKVRDLLQKILDCTRTTELSATEHSVDDYIKMIESRQALFDELAALNPQELSVVTDSPNVATPEIEEEIKSITNQIVEREKHHNSKVAGMMEDLKKGLRDLNNEKVLNSQYVKDSYESGSFFNKKN